MINGLSFWKNMALWIWTEKSGLINWIYILEMACIWAGRIFKSGAVPRREGWDYYDAVFHAESAIVRKGSTLTFIFEISIDYMGSSKLSCIQDLHSTHIQTFGDLLSVSLLGEVGFYHILALLWKLMMKQVKDNSKPFNLGNQSLLRSCLQVLGTNCKLWNSMCYYYTSGFLRESIL